MKVIKSIIFATVWGLLVLCTAFPQLVTRTEFREFINSEFYFASVGLSIIFMSVVFFADFTITYNFSSIERLKKGMFNIIMMLVISLPIIKMLGSLNEWSNLTTILSSIICFIIAKAVILYYYADEQVIEKTKVPLKSYW